MPTIDDKVVKMSFDNKQFEAGVSESLKTIGKLKEALNFDEVEGSLKNIENAFNNLNLSGLADSVDFIASRFEPLGKIADVALSRIADKALDAGKKITDAFFGFSDMSAGQGKYETQTKAVQTITNATGKSVDEVEKVLAKLQKYTDETSYDFAEMVNSIGKFTSVGVELERAERAMEGIASEAAKSGAGKAEANRAMYNFAQALSAGYVKLIDWKSIENANMATKEFKETLIETAIEEGVLERKGQGVGTMLKQTSKGIKETNVDYRSFNETLSEEWLTSDVLIKTLEKYADTTTKFGQDAYRAAQEALTWSDALGAVQDAVSSGWMDSFKYMFGNLDEARVLWTDIANALVEYVDIFASWRNEILKSWHEMGGYNDLIEAASNLWQTFMNIVKGVGDALTNVFPILKADNMTQALVDGTKKLKDWSAGLLEMFGLYQEVTEEEEETAEQAEKIADKTNEITESANEAAKAVSGLSEETKKVASDLESVETGLKRGMRGENVKKLQKELIKYGFRLDRFGADGIFGPETQAALKALQREIGVAETGIMDEATKAALQTDEALRKLREHAKKGISIGARGEDIKKLQKNLNKYLGESDQLIVDGIFGPKTEAAIKKLQKELGIAQTGVFDQTTRNAIKTKKILLMNVKDLSKELKEGMKGADVKKLQQELIKGGYLDRGMADGIYGPKTKEAIKKLQKALGIKQTGEWDKATQIALHNSQELTRKADATAKANKKISETTKKAAEGNKEVAKEADKATEHTTVAMMRLQNIVKGWGAALKIAAKFSGAIARIGGNILGMFKPLIDVAYRFGSVFGVMFENLAKDLDENDVYGSFVKKVTNAFGPFGKFIQNVADGLNVFLDSYDAFLEATGKKNTFGSFFGFLKDYVKRIPAIGFIIDVFKTVKSVVGPIISFLIEQLQNLIGWFGSDDFKQGKDSVFNWISEKFSQLRDAITKFKEDHPELTIENFLNKIKEIGGWVGGKFGEGIDIIKNKFAEFKGVVDQFAKDHPELSISNIFEKIKDTFKGIGDMFSKFFSGGEQSEGGSFFDALKERFKAFEPVLDWMEGIKDRIVKLWKSIFCGGEEIKTDSGVTETVKAEVSVFDGLRGKMSRIQSIVDWFANLKDKLINAWNDLTNVGKTGGPDLAKEGGFTTVFDRLGEFSREMAKVDLGKVISTALKAMAVYSLLNISNGIKNFGKGVGNFGKDLGKMVESLTKPFSKIADKVAQNFDFKGLSKAISERIKYGAQEKEAMSTKIMKLAGSILMVVAAIAIITKVLNDNDKDTVDKALAIVGGIIVALGLIAILMTVFSKKKEGKESDGSVTGILALCAGIYVIMLAIGKAVKIISGTTSDTLEKALWIVGGALVILGVISVLIAAFSKGEASGVKGILSLCVGVYVLVLALEKTLKVIKDVDEGTLKTALWIVGGATALLGIFAVLISAFSKGETSGVKGLLSMCSGIYVLVLALEKTVQLVTNTKNKEDLWSAVGIVGGMIVLLGTIAVLVAAFSKQPKVKVSIFKSLVGAVAVLVGLMAVVVGMIAQYNAGVVWQAFAMIAILVGGLGAIAVLMGGKETDKWTNLSSALVFLSMAYMIEKIVSTIGDVLYKIKDVNPDTLKWFFIGIDGAIAILALLVNAFTKIPLGSILSADVGLLAFIGVLAAGMEMIGSVAADLIKKFSYVIQTLGYCLGSFADSTSNLNFEQMKKIAKFVKEILPAIIKGIVELPTGEALNKVREIQRIGINLKNFGDFISSITKNTLKSADYSAKLMKKTKVIIDELNKITFPSLGKEGAMEMFGASLVIYGREIKHTDTSSASSVTQMIKESLEAVKLVKDATWLDGVTDQITTLGAAIKQYYKSFEDVQTDENGNAIEPKNLNIEGMAGYIRRLAGSFQDDETIQQISSFAKGGSNDMYQVGYGITGLGTALETYADSIGKLSDKETEIGLANGIIDKVQEINKSYDKDAIETFYNDFSGEFFNGTTLVAGNIVVLGEALGSYANNISIIEPSKVHAANLVLDKIKEIKQYLSEKDEEKPKNIVEKLVEALVMPNDFKVNEFAEDIQIIGEALEVYGGKISKLSIFQIWKANAILDSIANLNNSMPLKPGWFLQMMYDIETLQSFATGLKAIGEGLSAYWAEIKDLTFDDSKQESTNKILDGIADIAVKLSRGGNWISQARSAVPSVKGLTDGLSQVATDLVTFGSTVKSLDTSKTTEAVALLSGLVDAVSKVSWDDLMHGTGLFGANKVSKFAELGSSINAFLTNLTGSLDTELKNSDGESRTKIESAGQTIIDALSSGVTNAKIDGLNTAIFNAIDTSTFYASISMVSVMNTLGTDILSWIETGLKDESATTKITGSIESLIGKIKTVFTNNWSAFKGMGMFVNLGLATGMKENQSIVTQAAEDVALAAYLAAKKKLGIASPSTEFMWIGEMMDAGLTKGLETYGKTVSNAAGDVANNAVNTAAQGVLALNDVLGFDGDYQPVIRPVLDLSNIQANAGSINDLLTPKSITPVRSTALASNIAATQRSRQAVDVQSNGDGTYKVFGQALQKFDEKMQDVSEAIKNMKIYMDGTTLVGYVSPRVNRTLGHQATLAGRMN